MPEISRDVSRNVDQDTIKNRLERIRERIAQACQRAGRRTSDVTLVGVTKTFPFEAVEAAREAGLQIFGENRVQDLVEKAEAMPGRLNGGDVDWHMIGHLQRNKAKDVVEHVDFFEALDSPRLARELNKRAGQDDRIVPCFVQVNVSGEQSKYGIDPKAVHSFLDSLADHKHLRIEGLMTIASFVDNPEQVRPEFRALRRHFDSYVADGNPVVSMTSLSMGMSNDFEVAIEEGSSHVRIGSAIFGDRDY